MTTYNVVNNVGQVVWPGMLRRENAQDEADELNRTGLEEGRPYRVEPVEDLEDAIFRADRYGEPIPGETR